MAVAVLDGATINRVTYLGLGLDRVSTSDSVSTYEVSIYLVADDTATDDGQVQFTIASCEGARNRLRIADFSESADENDVIGADIGCDVRCGSNSDVTLKTISDHDRGIEGDFLESIPD